MLTGQNNQTHGPKKRIPSSEPKNANGYQIVKQSSRLLKRDKGGDLVFIIKDIMKLQVIDAQREHQAIQIVTNFSSPNF